MTTRFKLALRQKLSFPRITAGLLLHQDMCGVCLKDWGNSELKKLRAVCDQVFITWELAAQVTSFLRLAGTKCSRIICISGQAVKTTQEKRASLFQGNIVEKAESVISLDVVRSCDQF